jgi:hypothetical protein
LQRQLGVRQERQDARVAAGVWIIFYVGSGLELKQIEKDKIVLLWDNFPLAQWACGRRFYWGDRSLRILPEG